MAIKPEQNVKKLIILKKLFSQPFILIIVCNFSGLKQTYLVSA